MELHKIAIALIIIFSMAAIGLTLVAMLCFYSKQKVGQNNTRTEQPDSISDVVGSINKKSGKLSGNVQWGVKFYKDNYEYTTESKSIPSASVIKVYIMEYIFDQEKNGNLSMNDILDGSSVKNLLEKMITQSDNDATNTFITHFGMDKLNKFFKFQNYSDTKVERKMLDTVAQNQGKDNYTSVKDVMMFLDKIYSNKNAYPHSEMLSIMLRQQRRNKIPAKIPSGVKIANKTGELSYAENDIGIIFTNNGDFSLAFLCTSITDSSAAISFINDASLELYNSCMQSNIK